MYNVQLLSAQDLVGMRGGGRPPGGARRTPHCITWQVTLAPQVLVALGICLGQ